MNAPNTQGGFELVKESFAWLGIGVFVGFVVGICLMWQRFNDIETMHMAKVTSLKDQHRSMLDEIAREEVGKLQYQAAMRGYAIWVLDHAGKPKFKWVEKEG